jgi:hypothetical protein
VLRLWHSQLSNLAATIGNNKLMLYLLDNLEEFRDLSIEEWNIRKAVQDHLTNLVEQQRIMSVFFALARYRVVKIAHSSSEVVLRTTKHTVTYPGSGPSSEVIALCLVI